MINGNTIHESVKALQAKKISSCELLEACLARINRIDVKLKSFITVCQEFSLKQAKEADNLIAEDKNIFVKKPLLGIPISVKDNFCTSGIKTTASSKVLEDYIPPYDATVVEKLKKSGAIILGKTNMDAWAHGSSTETSQFFTTHNPWNPDFLPGGSSGGSAASVAADQTIAALGSETAGSIRQPAAWCGVTGLKPSFGRISRYGLIAMCSSTDCPGPLTKDVEDAAILLRILSGNDPKDATSAEKKLENFDFRKSLRGLRIGLPRQYFLKELEKEVGEKILAAVKIFEKLGAKIKWVDLLDPKYSVAVYTIIQRSEVSSNLARFDGIRYGNNRSFFGDEAKRRIMLGTYTLSAGYYDAFYKKAQKARTLIIKDFEKVFKQVDILLSATSPSVALPIGATKNAAMFGELQDILICSSSMAGLPAISIPCGFGKNNLPVGLQLIAPQFREKIILESGFAYQKQTDWHKEKPNL